MKPEEIEIDDIKAMLHGKVSTPIITISSKTDPTYKTMKDIAEAIYGDINDNAWELGDKWRDIITNLRYMEKNDYQKIISIIKRYEVKGLAGQPNGNKTYGYDRSRIDGCMIKRKRGN